jgi:hypothetical protein
MIFFKHIPPLFNRLRIVADIILHWHWVPTLTKAPESRFLIFLINNTIDLLTNRSLLVQRYYIPILYVCEFLGTRTGFDSQSKNIAACWVSIFLLRSPILWVSENVSGSDSWRESLLVFTIQREELCDTSHDAHFGDIFQWNNKKTARAGQTLKEYVYTLFWFFFSFSSTSFQYNMFNGQRQLPGSNFFPSTNSERRHQMKTSMSKSTTTRLISGGC